MPSSLLVRLFPETLLDFTSINTTVSNSIKLILAQHVESHSFTTCDFIVRTHAGTGNTVGAGITLALNLVLDGYAFDDPSTQFFGTGTLASVNLVAAAAPTIAVTNVASGLGRHLAAQLSFSSSNGNTMPKVYVSADLLLKNGDPGSLMNGPNSYAGYRIQ